ncbi:MAG: hypothetical protein ACHQNT_07360 [Bacteroidia bacterium]
MKRKTLFVLLMSGIAFLFSCKSYKEEFDKMTMERDSLIYVGDMKDSSINSFLLAFNEIEANLDTIAHKQTAIEENTMNPAEISTDQRERINEDIRVINGLLERNNKLIAELEQKVKSQGGRIAELKRMTAELNSQMELKEAQLLALNVQLDEMKLNVENLNVTIDTLTAQNLLKENDLKTNVEKLHAAWFVVGNFKELRDKNVVNKEGGFLGIGKNQLLKRDFNSDAFTKIDITQTLSIPFSCKEAKLITNHPSSSYTFEKDAGKIKGITITDFEKFWGASKYLVVSTE